MTWRVFKTRSFVRAATAEGLTDKSLKRAIQEIQQGLTGSAIGGNLIKKRVAIGNKGKSGGLRTILVYKAPSERVFCIYVFAKNRKDNIGPDELVTLRKLGAAYLKMSEKEIQTALDEMKFLEVRQDADEQNSQACES